MTKKKTASGKSNAKKKAVIKKLVEKSKSGTVPENDTVTEETLQNINSTSVSEELSEEEKAKLEREERKRAERVKNLNKVISKVLLSMQPPEDLTVSEWAAKHRRLSSEASAEPGRWRNERTPYLIEPMNAFTDPQVRNIVMVAASQVGKSEFINNCIGYVIDQDPGSILFIQPTTIDAREYSKLRIAPMIRDCPTLKAKVSEAKSRDSGNTILQKSYPGGILTLCGSTEAHALASKPIRYVFGDERDRWVKSAGDEGDPWGLAQARQTTFYNAKAVEVSTPTTKKVSAIEKSYVKGTMERWKSKCPHCGGFHEIDWDDIRYEYDESIIHGEKSFKITDVYYICPSCGGVSTEYEMKRAEAHWFAENPKALENGVRSFWLNAFVSSWASWESIILQFLEAQGDPEALKVVYNTKFGKLWEDRGETQSEDSLMARREEYKAEVPEGVLVLTMGVDTQDNRLEYEIDGFGHFGESWAIEKGIIMGRPSDDAVWIALDDIRERVFRYEDGIGIRISRTFIDEGGHYTMEVRQKCKAREAKGVFCIKGMGGDSVPYISPPKTQKIIIGGKYLGTCYHYQLGVDAGKAEIMHNLSVQTPGSRYCHFPKRDDFGAAYFQGLLSERLVYSSDSRKMVWKKIPGHERNEALDCKNYSLAAFKSLSVSLDATERRLREVREARKNGSTADTVTAIRKQKKKAQPQVKKAPKLGFDAW